MKRTAQRKRNLTAHCLTASLVLFLSNSPAAAQCMVQGTPQVKPELASLAIEVSGSVHRRTHPIHVTLVLRAGKAGAYLPDHFGPFMETCDNGFFAGLFTQGGALADRRPAACVTAGAAPIVQYVRLGPGEVRTWSTDIESSFVRPGKYCLYAEYMSPKQDVATGQGLPDDRALVAIGRITAKPVPVTLR